MVRFRTDAFAHYRLVIDELLTLLKVRGYSQIAFSIGETLFSGTVCYVEFVQPADILEAWSVFAKYRDKDWSFTDCVSKIVMQRLNVTTACAFDNHFKQLGDVNVVP
jgi:uncharacterized protein